MLAVAVAASVVTLLVTAFDGSHERAAAALTQPASVLVATRPSPQVLATVSNLRVRLPVAASFVTGIGFHGARDGALVLGPTGRQANEGLLLRLWRRIAGTPRNAPVWYQLSGAAGPGTRVLNVGAAPGTDVYAPVDGTIASISDFVIDGKAIGVRIDIRATQAPSLIVSLTHLRPDPSLAVGSPVRAATSKIGSLVDIAAVERQALASHARERGNNVAISVYPAAGALP